MSQPQRVFSARREDDDEVNTPLIARDIPGTSSSTSPRPNASRSFPQRSSHYNTFVEQQQQKSQARSNKPKLPMRTTKISQKLKLFPEDNDQWNEDTDQNEADVYTQIAKIPHGMARQEAEMLNKMDRSELSRMTAYCTASAYRMDALVKYLQSKKKSNGTAPKRFDECLYTPYAFTYPVAPPHASANSVNTSQKLPEMFLFDYGVVVFWGMTLKEEQRILKLLVPFEEEKLDADDVETEEFHYYYNEAYQPRIYNDIITLRHPSNYLIKLTIAHAIAQSVKMTLFERLIDDTINETKYIPQVMAESGNIQMSRTAITKKIGQLFIMRINVNLVSNILDTPEIFWSEPTLEPLYSAIRGYLEISQRVELLNQRVEVISDLLEMLKDHLNSSHGEHLEWIVIWLIGMEILVAVITTSLDAFSLYYNKE
ncbi:sporulation protein rmd1 [Mucor circinelloides]